MLQMRIRSPDTSSRGRLRHEAALNADLSRCLCGEAGPTGRVKAVDSTFPFGLPAAPVSIREGASHCPCLLARGATTRRSLDALNFFLADVHGGLGPYLVVYLLTVRHWNEAEIGIVMSIAGLAGILAQTPGGALVDAARAKRGIIVLAALIVTGGSIALYFVWSLCAGALVQAGVGAAGTVFGPTIAAISLGLVGHQAFTARNGRNQAFDHAGNAAAAVLAAASAYLFGPVAIFFCSRQWRRRASSAPHPCPLQRSIITSRAGCMTAGCEAATSARLWTLLSDRRLLVFTAAVALFHLANAATLPLVG